MQKKKEIKGKEVISHLADIYQQLYVKPDENGKKIYSEIVQKGNDAPKRDLSHFIRSDKDSLLYEKTPAGEVCVITLFERKDFITFLQIMGNKCTPVDIPDTQGASILDGVINWTRIYDHKKEFLAAEKKKGSLFPNWNDEFNRFTRKKSNYLDAIIVLSVGPYSNISAEKTGFSEDEWIKISYDIRRFHECTHFLCRRNYPDKIDAVWDELVADAVGIYGALGKYDMNLEKLFLGIKGDLYEGGRLENYVKEEDENKKAAELTRLAKRCSDILKIFDSEISKAGEKGPFDIAVMLEEMKEKIEESLAQIEDKFKSKIDAKADNFQIT